MSYDTFVKSLVVVPSGEPLFSEQATVVTLDDEGMGRFVVISQERADEKAQSIHLDAAEWPAVCKAINRIVAMCQRDTMVPHQEEQSEIERLKLALSYLSELGGGNSEGNYYAKAALQGEPKSTTT